MSKAPDLLESPKRRLKRAKQKIRRLEKRIDRFFKSKLGRRVTEVDSRGVTTHAFNFDRKIPDGCADAAVEAIEAMRSALDQCGYAVAVKAGITEPKNAYFPFADNPTDLNANVKSRCKDLPPEISALFRSFDSHEGGNYPLWALNELCNANKHRLLMPVGITGGGVGVNHMMLRSSDTGAIKIPVPTFDREKNQIVIGTAGPGAHLEYDVSLSFYVAFDEFNGVKGGPAVGILDRIAQEVDRVIKSTETECRKMGLA